MDTNEGTNAVEETQERNEKDIRNTLSKLANRETLKFVGLIVLTALVSIAGAIAAQKIAENFQSDETSNGAEPVVEETTSVVE